MKDINGDNALTMYFSKGLEVQRLVYIVTVAWQ